MGMGFKRSGTPDSLQRFLDEWADDSSASDLGADVNPAPEAVAWPKRTRDEAKHADKGPFRQQPDKKNEKAPPVMGTLVEAPLDVAPLRYKMPVLPVMHG